MKSKLRTLAEGIAIAFIVFLVCFFFLMNYVNSKFNEFYYQGYAQGINSCKIIGDVFYDNPFGNDIQEGIVNSVNLSSLNLSI